MAPTSVIVIVLVIVVVIASRVSWMRDEWRKFRR
jgi:hypothetical protein